jgi:uncharacterized repeat protein (TIGR03837 family)
VDDLASFAKLCPEADATLESQQRRGVEVCLWRKEFPEVQPASIVIEAFACKLPDSYVAAMAELQHLPVWINLEYLSAEDWVQGCHGLPSPHPRLPLTKYFFFPGFTRQTGGLFAVVAELSAITIGLVAGVAPARRAARLDPVEALHAE